MGNDGQNPIGNSPSSHPSAEHLQSSSFPMFPQSGGEPEKNEIMTLQSFAKSFLAKNLSKKCKANLDCMRFSLSNHLIS